MEIYLIRHTTPLIKEGICYGHSDIPLIEQFEQEASLISHRLPKDIGRVYSSPLQRCFRLARYLFPSYPIQVDGRLKELHFGEWELMSWDEIDKKALNRWMQNFVYQEVPKGESFMDLYQRSVEFYEEIKQDNETKCIITHAGVVRSILCYATKTDLIDAFHTIPLHYGSIIRLKGNLQQPIWDVIN